MWRKTRAVQGQTTLPPLRFLMPYLLHSSLVSLHLYEPVVSIMISAYKHLPMCPW